MPEPTVADFIADGTGIAVYCANFRCLRNKKGGAYRHGSEVDLEAVDPSLSIDDLARRLRCTVCGERQASIRISPGSNGVFITGRSASDPEVRQAMLRLVAEQRAAKRQAGAFEPARPPPWRKP